MEYKITVMKSLIVCLLFFPTIFAACTVKLNGTTITDTIHAEAYYKTLEYYTNFNFKFVRIHLIIATVDSHSTTIIIPSANVSDDYMYEVADVVYVGVNIRSGAVEEKITDGNFFTKETLLNIYDFKTKKRNLILSTTRNTNGYPITVFIVASHIPGLPPK